MKRKAFLVDDELLAVKELNWMLLDVENIEVIGSATTAQDAIEELNTLKPDLVFMDIHLPEKNGFEIIESLNYFPDIIFTTAYDEYAIKAFEINAIDYLLKPIGQDRLIKAISKLGKAPLKANSLLFIKDQDKMKFIEIDKINWIESVGNYIKIHHHQGTDMIYKTLNSIEIRLQHEDFFRANRKEIFNLQCIDSFEKQDSNWIVSLKDGKQITLSQRQATKFFAVNRI
jgi:two-component system, LytTR family, response regulator